MKILPYSIRSGVAGGALIGILAATVARAVDFHCATAQDVQNALTTAAANGANNNIYLTNGYYIGNFNFNSAGGYNLTISNEPSVGNSQIVLDGAGVGRDMSLSNIATGTFTVSGMTFLRDCDGTTIGALRIAGGSAASILIRNCQFLSPTNTSGMGLEIDSGLNASVNNCVVQGTSGGGSTGISVSGILGNVRIQDCTVATNVYGLSASGGSATITGNTFSGNSSGASCTATTIAVSGNIFTENSVTYPYLPYSNGGGLNCSGTTVLVSGNAFTGNYAGPYFDFGYSGDGLGGGVYCNAASVTLSNNTFNANSSYAGGGAYISGAAILTGNIFSGNSVSGYGGGGVYCSSAILTDNTFIGNSSPNSYGGGAYCAGASTLIDNTFAGNSSGSDGGGAYCPGGIFTVSSNTISQNTAPTGAGLYVAGPTLTLQDNLLVNNSQTSGASEGGGVWVDATSILFFVNNTITGNTAAGGGGGAAFEVTGTVELLNVYNNIIWGNSATGNGADVWLAGTGQKKVFEYNDVNNMYGVWDIALNNINLAPQFFNPIGGDYHYPENSPCANSGTNGVAGQPLADLDGNNRTNSLGQIDLGCYEFNNAATHPADTNGTFVITASEFAAYAAAWMSGQAWTNSPPFAPNPNPIPANYLTRAGYLMTNGGAYTNDGSARPTNWKPAQ